MSTSTTARRPRWLQIQTIRPDFAGTDSRYDSAAFRCTRCTAGGVGPPRAITREAADHVLAGHAEDQAAVEWAREVLPGVLS